MILRVRFAETDQMGIAHHGAYVVWFEAGRVEWLRDRGLSYRELEAAGISLAVRSLSVEYRSPARFDDELELSTRLTTLRSRGCRFAYRLTRSGGGLLASGATEHVATDRSGRATRIPPDWHQRLGRLVEGEGGGGGGA